MQSAPPGMQHTPPSAGSTPHRRGSPPACSTPAAPSVPAPPCSTARPLAPCCNHPRPFLQDPLYCHGFGRGFGRGEADVEQVPTQGKLRSLRHALEWDGHGRERHCLQSSDFWEKERRERREIREAKKFYWFILMSWE